MDAGVKMKSRGFDPMQMEELLRQLPEELLTVRENMQTCEITHTRDILPAWGVSQGSTGSTAPSVHVHL